MTGRRRPHVADLSTLQVLRDWRSGWVYVFALLADRATVLRRLRERNLGHAVALLAGKDAPLFRETFAVSKLDRCLARLREAEFAEHVWTDELTIPQVADRIAASAGLTLTPNTDGRFQGRLRRTWTSLRHIRGFG